MLDDINSIRSFDDIRLLYFKYKDTPVFSIGIAVIIAFIGIALISRIIIPQLESWFSIQAEIDATKKRIATLQANTNVVSGIRRNQLDEQFLTATTALPYVKDYTSIITTLDRAANQSGVVLDDYSFQVGNLSTTSAKLAPETAISVKLTVKGEIDKIQEFLNELDTITPLSEVVSITYANSGAGIGVTFFYKYLPEDLKIPYTDPLRTLNNDNLTLLRTLTEWGQVKTSSPSSTRTPVASTSGN